MIHPIRTARGVAGSMLAAHRARRTYRDLCDLGSAPRVTVDIHLEQDRYDDWTGMVARGLYGVHTTGIPLTPDGIAYIDKITRDIRGTCLRQLRLDQAGHPRKAETK